ncbi:MAG: VWA domain-containing protein [Planctomycetaceae bacterium]|nr:VWA domain-containing protein [Planctomycetaceae bacterium]
MTFVHPLAWFLLLLAIPIILFYILKIRLRQELVSTTIFWQQVFEERRSRSLWRRFRHLISLLLCLLFLAGLVGSALEPVTESQKQAARCVIVIDNSAGLNAHDAPTQSAALIKQTRLDQAKKELQMLLTTTDVARQTAILTAGGHPQIAVGFTDHLGTLRRGVESIFSTDHPSALVETIELALQLTVAEEDSSILVFTDGNTPGLTPFVSLPNVRFFPVGEPIDNIAITRFQPRRSLGDAVGYEVLVETVNHGTVPISARLEVELENRIVDVVPLTLEPGQPHTSIVRDVTSDGGLLRATLKASGNVSDGFPTDDTAIAFLPARPTQQVYLYGEDHFFLVRVLQSQPNVNLHFLTEVPQSLPADAVLVLHRSIPETIPTGNVLIIDPRNSCDLFDVGDPLDMPIVAKVSPSPLMRFVHLLNLMIPGARTITLKTKAGMESSTMTEHLAETPEEMLIYAHGVSPGQNVLVLSADLDRSDLPLRTAFPILVSQALTHFRESGGDLEKTYSTGDVVRVSLFDIRSSLSGADIDQVILRSPSGIDQSFPVKSGIVSLGMLPECGVWELWETETDRSRGANATPLLRVACNLANSEASNLRFAPESFYAQTPDTAALRSGIRPIWFWLALIALLLTVTEWLLYQRRWVD